MNFSIKTLAFVIAWFSVLFALSSVVHSEMAAKTRTYATSQARDFLCGLNLVFTIVVLQFAVASPKQARTFWIGTAIVATILLLLQLTDGFPNKGMNHISRKIVKYVIANFAIAGGGSGWFESHVTQVTTLLLYAWTPLLSALGGSLASWTKNSQTLQLDGSGSQ